MSNLRTFNQKITDPRTQEYLQNVLSEKKSSFVSNIIALVANNVKLQECEPMSLMHAGIKATALDLPLDSNLGFAYVIPYKNKKEKKTEAQFQIGYKGFIQLAIRSGQFKTINVTDVKEGELIHWDMLSGEVVFQAKPNREELKTIGYASYFRLTNGFEKTLYSTVESIDNHAKKYSQSYSSKTDWVQESSKWNTDFDAMAKKTVLKLLLSKYAPLSVDMRDAITSDQAVIEGENKLKYVDNESIEEGVAEEIETNANKDSLSLMSSRSGSREEERKNEKEEKVASKQTNIEEIPEEFR